MAADTNGLLLACVLLPGEVLVFRGPDSSLWALAGELLADLLRVLTASIGMTGLCFDSPVFRLDVSMGSTLTMANLGVSDLVGDLLVLDADPFDTVPF